MSLKSQASSGHCTQSICNQVVPITLFCLEMGGQFINTIVGRRSIIAKLPYLWSLAIHISWFLLYYMIITVLWYMNTYKKSIRKQKQNKNNNINNKVNLQTCHVSDRHTENVFYHTCSLNSPCPSVCHHQQQAQHFKAVFLPAALITKIICLEKHSGFLNISDQRKWHPCFYQRNQFRLSCALHALMSQPD